MYFLEELENDIQDEILLTTARKISANLNESRENMLQICIMLHSKYGISAEQIEKSILNKCDDNYVFYKMFSASEYADWIQLGVNVQKYFDRKQIYEVSLKK